MANISMTKVAISVGVGAVDEILEVWDEKSGRTGSFKTFRDYGRIAMPVVGYGLQLFMPRYANLGETLAVASTPLLVKSIARIVRGGTSAARQVSTPIVNRIPASQISRRVGTMGSQSEFQTTRAW